MQIRGKFEVTIRSVFNNMQFIRPAQKTYLKSKIYNIKLNIGQNYRFKNLV